jgi:ATP-dependent DNA helicase RecG
MTATPIPRSLALTLYGDLDITTLDLPPSGRLPVKTWVIPESKRESAYNWISSQLTAHSSQLFWVCPFIDPSETLGSVKAVTAEFISLQKTFPHLKLGLLHGRLKSKDKQDVLNQFRVGELDILVTTPVVEVGIDIPNATIMVIEAADRFGLAQLHQLRGRVGRGSKQAYCLLFSETKTGRLKAMEQYHSGRQLAEIDLHLRGPGDIVGTSQHGLPQFKIASYTDFSLIETARNHSLSLLPHLNKYPILRSLAQKDKILPIQPN